MISIIYIGFEFSLKALRISYFKEPISAQYCILFCRKWEYKSVHIIDAKNVYVIFINEYHSN